MSRTRCSAFAPTGERRWVGSPLALVEPPAALPRATRGDEEGTGSEGKGSEGKGSDGEGAEARMAPALC